ncbi:hypothetical protein MtrunA17_Chr2g0325251 [Medicago truncatula]|uniref:Uncharacterized protein n=1 Tax=Medicago truncatula TaxID=3880 RepID=A0A396JL53_MEDTR|nr:hypothetical protein MtrunA17_Chr2g0325251 [Medicago truncatula]
MDRIHILVTLKIQGILCPNFYKYYFDEKMDICKLFMSFVEFGR